jgi:hypothetical protein
MFSHYKRDLDLLESVTILDYIHWLAQSWHHDILSSTILACFYKSILVPDPIQLPVKAPDPRPLYKKVQQSRNLSDYMDISFFLNPTEKSQELSSSSNGMSLELLLELFYRASN